VSGYLASIAPPPPAFFRLATGRRYWHQCVEVTGDWLHATCGAVGYVGTAQTSAIVLDGEGCPNCERSAT
jgi:hypothetical protein